MFECFTEEIKKNKRKKNVLFGSYVVRLLLLYVVSPGTVSAFYYFVRTRKQMSVPCEHIACAMTVNTKVNERVARVGSELKHTGGKKSVESRRANNPSRKKCSFFSFILSRYLFGIA